MTICHQCRNLCKGYNHDYCIYMTSLNINNVKSCSMYREKDNVKPIVDKFMSNRQIRG